MPVGLRGICSWQSSNGRYHARKRTVIADSLIREGN